jgi:hypothetical protein
VRRSEDGRTLFPLLEERARVRGKQRFKIDAALEMKLKWQTSCMTTPLNTRPFHAVQVVLRDLPRECGIFIGNWIIVYADVSRRRVSPKMTPHLGKSV